MELFHAWATEQNLVPMEIAYIAHGPSRATLNFTDTNNSVIERFFRTHRVSRELSEQERERQKRSSSARPN